MTADHRSAHPNIPGVPWWGAVLIAATLIAIGFAYDAGSGTKELSAVFAGAYVVGCVLAVLAVRQAGIFTAVIQPPLLLFASVPAAYFLFTGSQLSNLKDTLINCAYPLIERFPLMFFTSAVVLLIGMARWYTGMSSRRGTPRSTSKDEPSGGGLVVGGDVQGVLTVVAPRGRRRRGRRAAAPPKRRRPPRPIDKTATSAAEPQRQAREPLHTLAIAACPSPRDRDHRARAPTGRADPRAGRQAEPPVEPRRKPRTSSESAQGHTAAADRRTGYERPERRRRYRRGPNRPMHRQQRQRDASPGIAGALPRRRQTARSLRAVPRPPADDTRPAVESWEYDI